MSSSQSTTSKSFAFGQNTCLFNLNQNLCSRFNLKKIEAHFLEENYGVSEQKFQFFHGILNHYKDENQKNKFSNFKNVEIEKPKSSRTESDEIFYVCQNFSHNYDSYLQLTVQNIRERQQKKEPVFEDQKPFVI